jgi:hypothetical protein
VVPGLAGCGVDTTDSVICNPAACQYNPNYSPPASPDAVPTVSSGPDDWWWNVNPCALMTTTELRRLGFPTARPFSVMHSVPAATTTPQSGCYWGFGANSLNITLAAVPYTYYGVTSGGITVPGEIAFRTADGRPGAIFPELESAGSCHVAFQATKGSSAVVLADRAPGTEVCKLAVEVANLIAPELPPGSQS